jgi:hypothetical protein
MQSSNAGPRVRTIAVAATVAGLLAATVIPSASAGTGLKTKTPAMLRPAARGVSVTPLITVGDTLPDGYAFQALPDGIAIDPTDQTRLDVYVNHETSTVPFPYNPATKTGLTDFDNAQLSHLVLKRGSGQVVSGELVIPSSANYQRFCSNFYASSEQSFDRPLVLTDEETSDLVNRSGDAWPATTGAEQAGVVVAYDPALDAYATIYSAGRMNHENSVAIPGYGHPVLVTGDDTFSAPSSQLYLYSAASADAVWNDAGTLYGFVSDDPAVNDYGDLSGSERVSGHFLEVPHAIAVGDQTGLEDWSNANNVFQFIRVEDLAYDRNDHNVIYFADTGEPRAIPSTTSDRLARGPAGTQGPYMNGRVFRLELDPNDPLDVVSLSILIDGDAGGYNNPDALHQPDNLETTATSMLIQEDEGGHNASFVGAQNNRVWQYSFATGEMRVVAQVDQALDPAASTGSWESTGIVDASAYFGPGAFLVNIQAHSIFVETAPLPGYPNVTQKEEGGQMLILRIPDA